MSGATFGILSAAWGLWLLKGGRWPALIAAGLTTLLLCATFGWRSTISWQAYADGEPKLFAASLITVMLIGSAASIIQLLRSSKAVLQTP
jgi:peptidoglycan/LPS O-acetylase OafA/YrhL